MLRFTNRRLFRLALRFLKALEAERARAVELTSENERLRQAIEDALLDADPTKFPYDRLRAALASTDPYAEHKLRGTLIHPGGSDAE